jgi:hypothetical protein
MESIALVDFSESFTAITFPLIVLCKPKEQAVKPAPMIKSEIIDMYLNMFK